MSKSNICRLCVEERNGCIPLTKGRGAEMLETLTGIKIAYNEKVSTSICIKCFENLETAFKIQQRILKVELLHHDELFTDFLIENHDDLVKLVRGEIDQMQIKDGAQTPKVSNQSSPIKANIDEESPVKHICGMCSDKFQFSAEFIYHLQQHIVNNQAPVQCDMLCEQCGEILPTSEAYNEHKNALHTSFACDTCFTSFTSNSMLEDHIKETHTNIKQFVCDVCNERFALRYILQVHKAQHNIKHPFLCDNCGRNFKYSVSLGIHQKMKHKMVVTEDKESVVPVKKQLFK